VKNRYCGFCQKPWLLSKTDWNRTGNENNKTVTSLPMPTCRVLLNST